MLAFAATVVLIMSVVTEEGDDLLLSPWTGTVDLYLYGSAALVDIR